MSLSVRARIVIAMSLVLAISLAAGVYATWAYARAADFARDARAASTRAVLAAQASQQVTGFLAEASNLALSIARAQQSAEMSAEYGGVNGTDRGATAAIDRLAALGGNDDLRAQWQQVREDVYHWINSESEQSGVALKMTSRGDGFFYASVRTTLKPSADIAGLSGVELRRAVRARQDALSEGKLRLIARAAGKQAAIAVAAEDRARETARLGTLALITAGILIAIAAGVWLYSSIARPLVRAQAFAADVSAGDLSARLEHHQRDEIGELTRAVEQMKDSVVARIDTMREVAGVVLVLTEHVGESLVHAERVAEDQGAAPELVSDLGDARRDSATLAGMVGQLLEA